MLMRCNIVNSGGPWGGGAWLGQTFYLLVESTQLSETERQPFKFGNEGGSDDF
jgi:hypothetical protein